MDSFNDLLKKFSSAFYSDDFQTLVSTQNAIDNMSAKNIIFKLKAEQNKEFIKFKEDVEYLELSISHLMNPLWNLISDVNDIRIETHQSGADFYSRASVLIESNIFETLSVLTEVDLLPSW